MPELVVADAQPAAVPEATADTSDAAGDDAAATPDAVPYVAAWSTAPSQFTPFIPQSAAPPTDGGGRSFMAYYNGRKYLSPALATYPNNLDDDWDAFHFTVDTNGEPNPRLINIRGAQGGCTFMVQSGPAPRSA